MRLWNRHSMRGAVRQAARRIRGRSVPAAGVRLSSVRTTWHNLGAYRQTELGTGPIQRATKTRLTHASRPLGHVAGRAESVALLPSRSNSAKVSAGVSLASIPGARMVNVHRAATLIHSFSRASDVATTTPSTASTSRLVHHATVRLAQQTLPTQAHRLRLLIAADSCGQQSEFRVVHTRIAGIHAARLRRIHALTRMDRVPVSSRNRTVQRVRLAAGRSLAVRHAFQKTHCDKWAAVALVAGSVWMDSQELFAVR